MNFAVTNFFKTKDFPEGSFTKDGHLYDWSESKKKFYRNGQLISKKKNIRKILGKLSERKVLNILDFEILLHVSSCDCDFTGVYRISRSKGRCVYLLENNYTFFDDLGNLINICFPSDSDSFYIRELEYTREKFFKPLARHVTTDPELVRIILKGFFHSSEFKNEKEPKSRIIHFTDKVTTLTLEEIKVLDSVLINEMDEDEIFLPIESFCLEDLISLKMDPTEKKTFFLLDYLNSGLLYIKIQSLFENEAYPTMLFGEEI